MTDSPDRDLTQGPIGAAIFALAVPMVLEMVLESTFAIADIFYVGKIGTDAVATVGLTESWMTLVFTAAMGLGIGAAAVVARRIGEKRPDDAARAAVQAVIIAVACAVPIGLAGAFGAPQLLSVMGASPEVVAIGATYGRVLIGGNVIVMLLFIVNAIFRGAGNGKVAMHGLLVANVLNLTLCPALVFGLGPFPQLGVTGAAVATTVARGAALAFVVAKLLRGGAGLHVRREHLRADAAAMRQVAKISGTAMLQVFIGMASWIGLVRTISTFGSAALAGYTIGIRVIVFALLPAAGLANAAATMVGQSLGAKLPERAEKAVWTASAYDVLFLGAIGTCFYAFAPEVVALFTREAATAAYGVDCLRVVALGFPFYAYAMVLTSAFNGAGDTATPTWINFGVFWLFEIPLAVALATRGGFGPRGVFLAILAAFSLMAAVSAVLFRRGTWKARLV